MLALSANAQSIDPQAVLNEVRRKVASTVQKAPRYTCMETITRYWYANRKAVRPGCDTDRAPEMTDRNLLRTDRLRLDVAVGSGQEIFSWHGQKSFQTDEIDELVTEGPVSSGNFYSFLSSIFLEGIARIDFLGLQGVASFGYSVPLSQSHFETHTPSGKEVMGYHGEFTVDPATGELRHLQILTDDMPPDALVCAFNSNTQYSVTVLNGVEFQLPTSVAMEILYQNHERAKTVTQYRQCREFSAASVFSFDDASTKTTQVTPKTSSILPAGLAVRIRIKTPLNPKICWAGDPIEGELAANIVDSQGKVLAPRGSAVQGVLFRIETWMRPAHSYTLELQFRELNFSGQDHKLNLKSLLSPLKSDTSPTSMPRRIQLDNLPLSDAPSVCRFHLNDDHASLKNVVTYWVTN